MFLRLYDIIEDIFFRPPKDVPRKALSLYHIRLHRFGDRLPKDDHIHNLPLGDRPLMGVHILIEYMQFYYFVSVCVSCLCKIPCRPLNTAEDHSVSYGVFLSTCTYINKRGGGYGSGWKQFYGGSQTKKGEVCLGDKQ